MMLRAMAMVSILAVPALAGAQAPRYTPQFLGSFLPGRMNDGGEVIGRTTVSGNTRAIVARAGEPHALLPLPEGMISSWANDINGLGMVVGQVGPFYSPEFSGRAAAWYPDGLGGYSVVLLGVLPGHVGSAATALNDRGDIVGWSFNGMYRYPVFFRGPGDAVDLSSTGLFDPVDINESRVVVDQSFTVKRLDLDTMIAEDLGVPEPPSGPRYLATRSSAINESSQVAGSAILATSTDCDRQAARYTDGVGWEIFTSCGRYNGASDINDLGDMVMLVILAPYARFEGGGAWPLESLIVNDVGHWYAVSTSAGWINNRRQIVMYGTNPATGQTGALLLTPEAAASVAGPVAGGAGESRPALSAEPNPFRTGTTIRFSPASPGPVELAIYDAAGREVAALLEGSWRDSGPSEVAWDGRDSRGRPASAGVYFARLEAGGMATHRRIVLLR